MTAASFKGLIVKLSSLGDVVHAMAAEQDMRRACPGVQVDWVFELLKINLLAKLTFLVKIT